MIREVTFRFIFITVNKLIGCLKVINDTSKYCNCAVNLNFNYVKYSHQIVRGNIALISLHVLLVNNRGPWRMKFIRLFNFMDKNPNYWENSNNKIAL